MEIIQESITGKRESNQDYMKTAVNQKGIQMAVLCDGMGGHQAGDMASKTAAETLTSYWTYNSLTDKEEISQWLKDSINEVNETIYNTGIENSDYFGMGSTIVVCVVLEAECLIANVGDSRAYKVAANQVALITSDHSFAYELYLKGEITKEEAQTHVQRNILTRSLGLPSDVTVDMFSVDSENLQLIFLCSDGLSNTLKPDEMAQLIEEAADLQSLADRFIERAYQNGSKDNISVILIPLHTTTEKGGN